MERRYFLKALVAAIGSAHLFKLHPASAQSLNNGALVTPLRLELSGPGRIGFYIDYSELDGTGTHTFYVCRTHGTEGSVSVEYFSSGDPHQGSSGTLSWGDGEADIKSFSVSVSSKAAGDHRIIAKLHNVSGGAALHHGDNTVAHGVIDDDTIATSNALFIDTSATSNGDGSLNNPFNSWYQCRDAVTTSTRYIYIKGMMVPNGTDTEAMSLNVRHLKIGNTFGGRSGEHERLYIRSWPGFTGGVDGNGQTNCAGFVCDGASGQTNTDISYITLRKLRFTNLDNKDEGSAFGKCYALRTRSGHKNIYHWTGELVDVNGINSGANSSSAVWFSEGYSRGYKMWRWTIRNAVHEFNSRGLWGFEAFSATEVSIQRCSFLDICEGVYEKEPPTTSGGEIGYTIRFNYFNTGMARFSSQGGRPLTNWTIVQGNVFDSPINHPTRFERTSPTSGDGQKPWVVGNVYNNWQHGTIGAVWVNHREYKNLILFNNIFRNVRVPYRIDEDSHTAPEVLNHNHYHNGSSGMIYRFDSGEYSSLSSVRSANGYDLNSVEGDAKFVDPNNGNFRLGNDSPCRHSGVGGSTKGAYLTGVEIVGATNPENLRAPPAKISQLSATVVE